ncbi:MerR family transcriptional regulator [Ligilactobacillus agilis]|uniref:MerR family transcriptional regulator n=1 Tax=Ligilactobacillus agilis TaxID=1601 RepID=UPI003D80562C
MIAEEKYYRIGEVAKLYNLTTPTIRFYEEIGLFPNLKRSAGGLRMFSAEELACIEDVECLKKTGMSLKDIADYIKWKQAGDSSLLQRLELIKKQKQSLEQNIFDLQRELEKLKHKEWYYQTAVAAGTEAIFSGDCDSEYYRAHPDEVASEG